MTTYDELYGPPVDVLHPTVKVYAVDDNEGVPIRHLAVHLTPGEGRMLLPRGLKGDKGDDGAPATAWQIKGERTTAQLAALTLGASEKGWAYKNSQTNALHYWDGTGWIVLTDAFGTDGPVGPAGSLSGVNIQMKAAGTEPEAYLTGPVGNQSLILMLPEKPGPKGDAGPAAAIASASDFDTTTSPAAGDFLTRLPNGKWGPGSSPRTRYYSIPEGNFTDTGDLWSGQRATLVSLSLDQLTYSTFLEVTGHMRVGTGIPASSISIEVRIGDAATGELIARGYTSSRTGEDVVAIHPHFSTNAQPSRNAAPGGTVGIVPASHTGTAGTLYVTAVRTSGLGSVRAFSDDAQLLIKRLPAV
ncbi:minor tail protein [Gordonia phage Daredevil]|uniref:Minor tail protein n=1 Tax=Gordonia phage Daredevil TaxID=2283286 RepID=A0A345MIP2_9CAUD|nr:minor tail protein [Gordonia phage Daredevil]AXH70423.1 minor tail protein [Gordonia phage Daredevil]